MNSCSEFTPLLQFAECLLNQEGGRADEVLERAFSFRDAACKINGTLDKVINEGGIFFDDFQFPGMGLSCESRMLHVSMNLEGRIIKCLVCATENCKNRPARLQLRCEDCETIQMVKNQFSTTSLNDVPESVAVQQYMQTVTQPSFRKRPAFSGINEPSGSALIKRARTVNV